ncbi:MAG TPA: tRNA (adenosine(37)-N6)-dimethylallyltransferase MiaA [Clostridiales bacterium]|nr:tRNA (adenosine(37)-N6)-dimethylallyltransferase MiaA [Clostridiales bacterium]HPV01498.1 tRNA (adenosine(37)-N6)-dimethylallyltransferase MiaA [Clostridiales bacterium]
MEPVIVIAGPTASGKTRLSIELAKLINGSIVSADSMQIYRYMDIGTAKPDGDEMSGIRHYMIDEVDPDENYSVARYRERALECIADIIREGRRPIVAGGTGLYINSLIYNINFSETICDEDLRNALKAEAEQKGNRYLYEKLMKIDPEAAKRIHENDIKRIIRAIEVYTHTQKTISEHIRMSRLEPPPYRYIVFGLRWDREKLYRRINKRVDDMIRKGLIEETRRLVEMGFDRKGTAMQAIGYKEILPYLKGECSLEEAVEILKRNTRRYAKRQMTWFRQIREIIWLDMDEDTDCKEAAEKIIHHCIETFGIIL